MESGEGLIAGCADVMESGVGPLQENLPIRQWDNYIIKLTTIH